MAWGITGAGHFLEESIALMSRLKAKFGLSVTTYVSAAGLEVLRMYGLWPKVLEISPGGYYEEIFAEPNEGRSFPNVGRLQRGAYAAFIIAPCTANTVAKMVHGIADELIASAFAQAQKGGVRAFVLPTDASAEYETKMPHVVDRDVCRACERCDAYLACRYGAISIVGGKPRINLLKCVGCGECAKACKYGAVKFGAPVKARARRIDLENVRRLEGMEGVSVARSPGELEAMLEEHLAKASEGGSAGR